MRKVRHSPCYYVEICNRYWYFPVMKTYYTLLFPCWVHKSEERIRKRKGNAILFLIGNYSAQIMDTSTSTRFRYITSSNFLASCPNNGAESKFFSLFVLPLLSSLSREPIKTFISGNLAKSF